MKYGDETNFVKKIKQKKDEAIKRSKDNLIVLKSLIRKQFNKEFLRRKAEIILSSNNEFESKKNKILFEHNSKFLELREEFKNEIINLMVEKLIKRIRIEKNKKSKIYSSFVKDLIIEGAESLGGKEFSVQLAKNDSWIKKKLNNFSDFNINFIKLGDFDFGVKVYKNNMKELVNNSLKERIILKHHDLYKLVDKRLKWEK